MASSLIDSMTTDFDPDAHHDRYREALTEVVEAKVAGRELLQPGTVEIAATPAVSLTEALKASLAAAKQAALEPGTAPAKAKEDAAKPGDSKPRAKGAGAKAAASKPARKAS